jgi:4-amino-4-deoxy-L-arabinose transferase-like glycosyltransferase
MKNKLIIAGVLSISLVNAFWMLSARSLNSHECFVGITAREMIENNNYLWPTLNGEPRLQKTPLNYWLVAAAGKLTGKVDELTTRLPSAIFAFLSAAAILYYLSRWLLLRTAAISTAVWSTSLAYLRSSHDGRPDTVMTFFIVLCMLSFYGVVTSENRRGQVIQSIIFWISFALANLSKGPAPVAYITILIAVYIIFTRNWRIIGRMLPVAGILIFLVIVLPWPLYIAIKINWNLTLWKNEFIDRLSGDYAKGNYPIYYYLPMMFKYITPWVVFLPICLAAPFYRVWKEKRPLMIYLWIWFAAGIIFLTIDAGKRQHYIIPLIPAMAMLTGIVLDDMIFSRVAFEAKFVRNILAGYFLALIAAAAAGAIFIARTSPEYMPKVFLLVTITISWATAVVILFIKHKERLAAVGIFAGIMVFIIVFYYNFTAAVDKDADSRVFGQEIARRVPASEKLVSYGMVTSRLVFNYGKSISEIEDFSEIERLYEEGCWIICITMETEKLRNSGFNIVYSRDRENIKSDGGILIHKPVKEDEKVSVEKKSITAL